MLESRREDGYLLSADPDRIDLPRVHRWLSTDAYWALGRPVERMRDALAGSEPFGVYLAEAQVAVARVITDGVLFAYLCDVYVDREHRGRGLGRWLVRALRDHYAERGLNRLLLVTKDAQALYAREGFTAVEPGRWMELDLRRDRRLAE